LPSSGCTINRYVLTWYRAMGQDVMSQLNAIHTKIHFCFDMWSGPNRRAYQAIVAHWMARNGWLHAVLLSLYRFQGSHSVKKAEHHWFIITDVASNHSVACSTLTMPPTTSLQLQRLPNTLNPLGFFPLTQRQPV
jgi:hypothetical protein